jgi:uncharacterized protein with HEPN domain
MSKDQRIYLRDILERIERIKQVIAAGEVTFRESFLYQDALIRSFEVICNAPLAVESFRG